MGKDTLENIYRLMQLQEKRTLVSEIADLLDIEIKTHRMCYKSVKEFQSKEETEKAALINRDTMSEFNNSLNNLNYILERSIVDTPFSKDFVKNLYSYFDVVENLFTSYNEYISYIQAKSKDKPSEETINKKEIEYSDLKQSEYKRHVLIKRELENLLDEYNAPI